MIKILRNFFDTKDTVKDNSINNVELLSGLMIEAANVDGNIDTIEIEHIRSILINTFEEDPQQVEEYLARAINDSNNSKSLFYYTSKLNKEYSYEKKLLLIETLWEIILSDEVVDDYESNLIRRLSGLLYISDIDSGNARKRALNKISK